MYKPTKFFSYSFGCRVNEAERAEIDRKMIQAGFLKNEAEPDVYIVNTCAVTAKAEREARQLVLRLKKEHPGLKLVVAGCSATYWQKNGLWQNMPIDLIISNNDKEKTVELILEHFHPHSQPRPKAGSLEARHLDKFLDSGRVMVKIQDGCHRFCSYCIVPYLRGLPKSRTVAEIASSVKKYSLTMKEAVLTAINTEAFGRDTGESLESLVQTILASSAIPRLSFGSIHPWSITPSFLDMYRRLAGEGRFSRFFHIPLQSGSNRTLTLMRRGYTREEMLERMLELKRIHPDTLLATDIIAGYLDESDSDFEDTLRYLELSPLDKLHVFRFSKRQNTAAFFQAKRLKEPSPGEKAKRSKALISLSNRKYQRFLDAQVGKSGEALFIGNVVDGMQKALFLNQVPVMVPVKQSLSAELKHVTITKLKDGIPVGKIV